jgi:hypothetical protein
MSINEISNVAEKLELKKFERLYQMLYAQKVKRNGVSILNEQESNLLTEINEDFDIKKWERLKYLDWKLESSALTSKEETELLKLAEAYESYSVERLKKITKLAMVRQVSIDSLLQQLGIHS